MSFYFFFHIFNVPPHWVGVRVMCCSVSDPAVNGRLCWLTDGGEWGTAGDGGFTEAPLWVHCVSAVRTHTRVHASHLLPSLLKVLGWTPPQLSSERARSTNLTRPTSWGSRAENTCVWSRSWVWNLREWVKTTAQRREVTQETGYDELMSKNIQTQRPGFYNSFLLNQEMTLVVTNNFSYSHKKHIS